MAVSLTFVYLTLLYVLTDTQQRPIFIAGVLAIISVLLLLVGFLAELIVSQGERIADLERELPRRGQHRASASVCISTSAHITGALTSDLSGAVEANVDRVDAGRRYRV